MRAAAIIVAAGRGARFGGPVGTRPKQYHWLGGRAIIDHAIEAFADHPAITDIVVVIHSDDTNEYARAVSASPKLRLPAIGGASRQASVARGLDAVAALWGPARDGDLVLIHDAARPFVSQDVISRVIAKLANHPAVVAAVPVVDTLKRASSDGVVTDTIDRSNLWRAQTPQGFAFDVIKATHARATNEGRSDFTDDAALAEWAGFPVAVSRGCERNTKITTAEDLAMAQTFVNTPSYATDMETRTATGFDIHKFTDGDHVWLGGVRIPHVARLDGHSDADVVLHALTDALLGCIGDGDIGQHFPPSDPQWKGAASILFLKDAHRRVSARGGKIINVDVTILAEAPKVGPHRAAMQAAIGAALGLTAGRIGIKATTMEGLGAIGRREGIAASATATVLMPSTDAG